MSLQDTAYPRLKTTVTADELQQVWTPTDAEHRWVRSHARGPVAQFGLLASLKIFQRLGYFLPLVDLPKPIWDHLVQHIKPGRTRAELLGYDHPAPAGGINGTSAHILRFSRGTVQPGTWWSRPCARRWTAAKRWRIW